MFDFEPWLLIVENSDGVSYYIESTGDYVRYPILNVRCNKIYSANSLFNNFTWTGNSVSWYTAVKNAEVQSNKLDTTYNYIVLG